MESKLNLDFNLVEKARAKAKAIAIDTQEFIEKHTTVTVERAVCRLLGIDGVDRKTAALQNSFNDFDGALFASRPLKDSRFNVGFDLLVL